MAERSIYTLGCTSNSKIVSFFDFISTWATENRNVSPALHHKLFIYELCGSCSAISRFHRYRSTRTMVRFTLVWDIERAILLRNLPRKWDRFWHQLQKTNAIGSRRTLFAFFWWNNNNKESVVVAVADVNTNIPSKFRGLVRTVRNVFGIF